jgi:hypothetical protein
MEAPADEDSFSPGGMVFLPLSRSSLMVIAVLEPEILWSPWFQSLCHKKRKVGVKQQIEKNITDRGAYIQTGNVRRKFIFGFQIVDHFRSKTVITKKRIATPKH